MTSPVGRDPVPRFDKTITVSSSRCLVPRTAVPAGRSATSTQAVRSAPWIAYFQLTSMFRERVRTVMDSNRRTAIGECIGNAYPPETPGPSGSFPRWTTSSRSRPHRSGERGHRPVHTTGLGKPHQASCSCGSRPAATEEAAPGPVFRCGPLRFPHPRTPWCRSDQSPVRGQYDDRPLLTNQGRSLIGSLRL